MESNQRRTQSEGDGRVAWLPLLLSVPQATELGKHLQMRCLRGEGDATLRQMLLSDLVSLAVETLCHWESGTTQASAAEVGTVWCQTGCSTVPEFLEVAKKLLHPFDRTELTPERLSRALANKLTCSPVALATEEEFTSNALEAKSRLPAGVKGVLNNRQGADITTSVGLSSEFPDKHILAVACARNLGLERTLFRIG
eukprot:1215787-Amphidinium_carterae.2